MGYILPIKNSQYYDYQQRVVTEKKNHYFIDKPFKVVLESQHEHVKNHFIPTPIMDYKEHSHTQLEDSKTIKAYADMTGKGKRFSGFI